MNMIWIIPLLLFSVACSCSPFSSPETHRLPSGAYDTYTQKVDTIPFSEVIIPYAVELQHTKRLRFEDSKVYFDDFVGRVRVIFSSQEILELCEARDLLVTVVEGLLERLNATPSVVENFDHFPITADDLELYFSFESFDIEYNDGTYIAWMSLHDGFVRYINGLVKNPRIDFWDARIEAYSKSLLFVQLQRAAEEYVVPVGHTPKHTQDSRILDL
jgi:hypothetical protein